MVDVQNDFCDIPGASLPVSGGADLAGRISGFLRSAARSGEYAAIAATRDWHVEPGDHFSAQPDYSSSWPPHCVAGSSGAEFHPDLDLGCVGEVFSKGGFSAAYSGFEGCNAAGETLSDWAGRMSLDGVDVVGIATDYCVRATVLDAAALGLRTRLLLDLCVGVDAASSEAAVAEMSGVAEILSSADVLS